MKQDQFRTFQTTAKSPGVLLRAGGGKLDPQPPTQWYSVGTHRTGAVDELMTIQAQGCVCACVSHHRLTPILRPLL